MTIVDCFYPCRLGMESSSNVVVAYDLWLNPQFVHIADLVDWRLIAISQNFKRRPLADACIHVLIVDFCPTLEGYSS